MSENCLQCSEAFEGRSDKLYCSKACKQKAYRQRQKKAKRNGVVNREGAIATFMEAKETGRKIENWANEHIRSERRSPLAALQFIDQKLEDANLAIRSKRLMTRKTLLMSSDGSFVEDDTLHLQRAEKRLQDEASV